MRWGSVQLVGGVVVGGRVVAVRAAAAVAFC